MKILFTGASSFTGYWFIRELVKRGHQVTATFRSAPEAYSGVRRLRVEQLKSLCQPLFGIDFGSADFLKIIAERGPWDLLCHHAADVSNYKSPDFDFVGALDRNAKNLPQVLKALQKSGCSHLLLTGSVFEQDEGQSSGTARAFSPYGLSKGLTHQVFRYFCETLEIRLGKFIVPNPFGPFEEPRFTSYLVQNWFEGNIPKVTSPAYVRDNIHVDLLAKAYAAFAEKLKSSSIAIQHHPSGYPESQGAFTARFAREMEPRLAIPCSFELLEQREFPEPFSRVNRDQLSHEALKWSESAAWDALADYYLHFFNKKFHAAAK